MPPRERALRLAALLLCAAAVTALLAPALAGNAILGFRDMLHNYGPMKELFWRGPGPLLPLWNDRAFGGSSLLADVVQQPFYLPNLAFRLARAPAWPGIAFYLWLHLLLALWGAWALCRRWAGEIAAVAFVLCGFTLANLTNLQWACAAAWAPAVLAACRGWAAEGGRRRAALLALALPQPLLAGDPHLCLLLGVIGAGLALAQRGRRILREGMGIALLAAVIASPQLAATLKALPDLSRAAGFPLEVREQWSLHPARLAELFVPRMFGPLFSPGFWGELTVSAPWQRNYVHSIYLGLAGPALVALALARRRREAVPWTIIALAAALLAMGGYFFHLYGILGEILPFFRAMRYPQRLAAIVSLAWAVLMALGAAELPSLTPRARVLLVLASTALAAAALGTAAALGHPDGAALSRSFLHIALAGGAVAAAMLLPSSAVVPALGMVLVADLCAANGELLGLMSRFRSPPAACAALDAAAGGAPRDSYRVFVDQQRLERPDPDWERTRAREYNFGKRNLLEECGFRQAVSLTSLEPAAATRLWEESPLRLLSALGTRFVITAPGAAANYGARERSVDTQWGFAVGEIAAAPPLISREHADPAARLLEREHAPGRIAFRVSQPAPGNWLLLETLDSDWIALVDGSRAPILRPDPLRRAVWLPAGEHRVELIDRPLLPLGLFALSLLLAAALAVQASRRTPGAAI